MRSSRVEQISSDALPRQSKPARGPWVASLVLILIGFIVFRAAAGSDGFDWRLFAATPRSIDPGCTALAILFILLSYAGRVIRWEVMTRPLGPPPSLWRLFVGTAIGFTAIVLLGRPGEFVRPWWIARESQTPFSAQLAIWFFERIYDLLVVILFFGFGLTHLAGSGLVAKAGPELQAIVSSGGYAALAGAAVCLGFIFVLRFLDPSQIDALVGLLDRFPTSLASRLRPMARSFLDGAAACCTPGLQPLVFLYTFLEWVIIAACYWAIFQAFPFSRFLSLADIVTIVGLVSFGAIIQLPGIGGGFQVAAIAVLTQFFTISLEAATSLALVLWGISFTVIVPVGIFLALREGLSFKRLRSLDQETP
jgi:uncharacterized membrane protein YbhN (UPF0104 family)